MGRGTIGQRLNAPIAIRPSGSKRIATPLSLCAPNQPKAQGKRFEIELWEANQSRLTGASQTDSGTPRPAISFFTPFRARLSYIDVHWSVLRAATSGNRPKFPFSKLAAMTLNSWLLTSDGGSHRAYASAPGALAVGPDIRSIEKESRVQVLVRDNNVDQALKVAEEEDAARGRLSRDEAPRPLRKAIGDERCGKRRKPSAAPASLLARNCSARDYCR